MVKAMSKYHNQKTDGFDSKKERDRYFELKLMERAGQISNLRRQVRFTIIPKQFDYRGKVLFRERYYVADFVYIQNGRQIVEDTKGYRTDVYRMKKALMYERHGILIKET